MAYLSGFIAIVGPPNVGKSTLLNRLIGSKLAIVSPKPQTTRNRILGVYHGNDFQIVFIDTPGIHRGTSTLHRSMVLSAQESLREVDMVILIIDIQRWEDPVIDTIIRDIGTNNRPCFLIINKIDTVPREEILPVIDILRRKYRFRHIVPVSALKGDGITNLLGCIKTNLQPGPVYFPEDMNTDQSESFFISEIIREKIFLHARYELPYSSAVTVESIEENKGKNMLSIMARIHVESESQKVIMIGHKGGMIKKIGISARMELERHFGKKVFLKLLARVEKNWSKDGRALRRFGY
ncbi:MAG: GTPase Era [Deltaproteobacteria bacterium]|nr:GTPase Era [Deltaproteobacteria bacterium]